MRCDVDSGYTGLSDSELVCVLRGLRVGQTIMKWSSAAPWQLHRLRLKGDVLAAGLLKTGEDLLHDAVERTLDGRRRYRQDLDISTYLHYAMRSIASAEREKERREEPLGDPSDESSNINRIASPESPSESTVIEQIDRRQMWAHLREALADDQNALAILERRLEGWTNEDIMELESMDPGRFHAARKRFLRAGVRVGRNRGGK